jgi:hypothetical protein
MLLYSLKNPSKSRIAQSNSGALRHITVVQVHEFVDEEAHQRLAIGSFLDAQNNLLKGNVGSGVAGSSLSCRGEMNASQRRGCRG